jgi:hypothetical protein
MASEQMEEKATVSQMNLVQDLTELREMVQGTYGDLQTALQQTEVDQSQIQTLTAAFQLAMGASLKRLNEVAQDPPKVMGVDDRDDAIEALANLTWYLLRVAPFLANPNQNIIVARSTGALVECLGFDERLATKEHCGFLFHNVANYLRHREKCLAEESSTEQVDALLQAFCPPLMVYFAKNLSLLKELREDAPDVVSALQTWRRPVAMIRRLLLQAVDETILLAWVEKSRDDAKPTIRYAQRVKFTGLYVNKDLVEWATSKEAGLDPKIAEAGTSIEMSSWTGLIDEEEGIMSSGETQAIKPHRIYQEGIPDDIPTLNGERIVLCYKGLIERKMSGKVFPAIELKALKEGEQLTDAELDELQQQIEAATDAKVEAALGHQMQRGSNDEIIRMTMLRLSMATLLPVEALN